MDEGQAGVVRCQSVISRRWYAPVGACCRDEVHDDFVNLLQLRQGLVAGDDVAELVVLVLEVKHRDHA